MAPVSFGVKQSASRSEHAKRVANVWGKCGKDRLLRADLW
jgi:hypothetical protein